MKNIIVIYHGDCSDGFGGAWAAWKKFGEEADYIAAHHQEPPLDELENKEIYFIDFIYPAAVIKKLLRQKNQITAIDHHATAEETIKSAGSYVFDNNHSGAALAWRYFHPHEPLPRLLRHIEDFDLWKFKLAGTKALMIYMPTVKYDFSVWNNLIKAFEKPASRRKILQKGNCYLELRDKLLEELATENSYPVMLNGHRALAVNAPHFFASDLGALLYGKRTPVAIVWNQKKDVITVSLRSDGSVHVGELAKKYGGGGHKAAAGFRIIIKNQLPWNPVRNRGRVTKI